MTAAVGAIRLASDGDVTATAGLHGAAIVEGFLPSLGPRVLRRLHRRMTRDPGSFVLVAENAGTVTGFVAGTTDVRALYRTFVRHDGVAASLLAVPRAPWIWRRAWETLRYPSQSDPAWPPAELLALAVADDARHRGVGRALTGAFQAELRRRAVVRAKVVVSADNGVAIALYQGCGFRPGGTVEVHAGHPSEVLVWP